jgi:hypothetical protein
MNEGMIFHGWHKFIERLGQERLWLYKVLGGCTYCYGTWIFIIFYMSVFPLSWFLLIGIGFNYVFIKAIERL